MLDKQNEALERGLRRLVAWYLKLRWPWKALWSVAFLMLWVWIEWREVLDVLRSIGLL
jgi:dTDP-D-glucose 4,6-dehydratase